MKNKIIIICGVIVAIVLGVSYGYLPGRESAPAVSATPAVSYSFVGTVISMKSNILWVRGLPAGGDTKVAQDIMVTMTPDTKIFRKDPPSVTPYARTESTMDELYETIQKGPVLFRATAGYDFYGTGKVTPTEVIFAATEYKGSI